MPKKTTRQKQIAITCRTAEICLRAGRLAASRSVQ